MSTQQQQPGSTQPPQQPTTLSDAPFYSENDIQLPLPSIQPDYTFLPDHAVSHNVPPIDTAFIDANPNVIHSDIFAGIQFNLVDPFKYIWDTTLLGQPCLDAEDLALFPAELIEELIKDPQHKTVIPALDDISEARHRLLNLANFFHPDGDLDEDQRKAKQEEMKKVKTLDVVKPHQFQDDLAKAKTMESAQRNAMNYYYQPVYTEDTIQTWVSKRKYVQYAEQQRDLERVKNLGVKKMTTIETAVTQDRASILSYIDDSFEAMNETPIHPDHPTVGIKKVDVFFAKGLEKVIEREHPQHLPPLSEAYQSKLIQNSISINGQLPVYGANNNTLSWVTGTSETKLGPDSIIMHEEHGSGGERLILDAYSLYRNAKPDDVEILQSVSGFDEETIALLNEAAGVSVNNLVGNAEKMNEGMMGDNDNNNNNNNTNIENENSTTTTTTSATNTTTTTTPSTHSNQIQMWDSLAQRIPISQLGYEDSFIMHYDNNGNIIANVITQRVRLKPFQLAAQRTASLATAEEVKNIIAELPMMVTVNHPGYYQQAFGDGVRNLSLPKKVKTMYKISKKEQNGDDDYDYSRERRAYGDDEDEDAEDESEEEGIDLYAEKDASQKKSSRKDKKSDKKDKKDKKSDKKDKKDKKSDKKDKKSKKDTNTDVETDLEDDKQSVNQVEVVNNTDMVDVVQPVVAVVDIVLDPAPVVDIVLDPVAPVVDIVLDPVVPVVEDAPAAAAVVAPVVIEQEVLPVVVEQIVPISADNEVPQQEESTAMGE